MDYFARSEAQSHRVATGGAELWLCDKRSGLLVLAGLVGDAAAGLAGALAGGLALAAAAVLGAGAEITGLEGLYSLHVLHSNLILAALCGNLLIIEYSMTADLSRGKAKFPAGTDKRSI